MKNKVLFSTIILVAIILFPVTCYAWTPSTYYYCWIDYYEIPENAKYIDLLLPISVSDANYTDFNSTNGEKFSISAESEIVKYNVDGYMSYSFHINDAISDIKPYYFTSFFCDESFYNENQILFDKLKSNDSYRENFFDDSDRYLIEISHYLYSDSDIALEEIYELLYSDSAYIDRDRNNSTVGFFDDRSSPRLNADEYLAFCKKYGAAKMAYLDENGNIISISNAVDIFNEKDVLNRTPVTHIVLTGNELTCEISYGPPFYLLGIFIIGILFSFTVSIIVAIVFIIKLIASKIKRYKCNNTIT